MPRRIRLIQLRAGQIVGNTYLTVSHVNNLRRAGEAEERVSDALYAEASQHYDDKALVTLTMAIGQVCFFIPLALIGKPFPGVSPAEQWRE